jgi:hypothetical protein
LKLFRIKPAKTDYTDSMLPKNRKEVFGDVFKLHWKSFLLLGLITLIFSVPFIFIDIYEFFAIINIENEENLLMNSILVDNMSNLLKLPFILLLSILISGLIRIIRQFSWLENVTLSYDFFLGVKQNVRQVFITILFVGILWYLSMYCLNISQISENFMKYVLVLPIGLFIFVVLPIAGNMLVSISMYNNSILQNIKVAFVVYASNPFKNIACTLLCTVIFMVGFVPYIYVQIIVKSIGYIIFPFLLLGFYLYTNKRFDEIINKHYYPELVNKGLNLEKTR